MNKNIQLFSIKKEHDSATKHVSGKAKYTDDIPEPKNLLHAAIGFSKIAKGKINNITIGRTDLSRSYFDPNIKPDSPFIFDLIERLSHKVKSSGLTMTLGGSLTSDSLFQLRVNQERLVDRLFSVETRKIIFPTYRILDQENALKEALRFEEFYLRFKLESEAWFSRSEQERLAELKKRV